ncbi:hypothetical protein [Streptomyces misionensis]|uniref:hypothetical protein n=1 Tax=Streptomyces misionensis TaxID=67331 RepID=UPI0036AFDAF4
MRTSPAESLAALPLVAYAQDLPIVRRHWRNGFATDRSIRSPSLFPISVQSCEANVDNGLIAFRTFDAQGVMLAGNLMAVTVGAGGSRIGLSRGQSPASTALGTAGSTALPHLPPALDEPEAAHRLASPAH